MNGNRFGAPPVSEGEEIDVKIEAIGDKGDGIAKKDGFVLVIPGTNVGDEVRVRVTKVIKRVGFAEVIGDSEKTDEPPEEPSEESESDEESSEESDDSGDSEEEPGDEPKEPDATPEDSEDFGEDEEIKS